MAATHPNRDRRRTLAICVGLAILVVAVFGQTVRFGFVNLDDGDYVYENSHLADGLSPRGIAWAFTETSRAAHWHPLTWLSLLLDSEIYGRRQAAGYHLTNVLLHAANAIVLFLALREMTGDTWPSALVAALFAAHPLHVESVAWITERKDVLSGLFGLLALWAYARYARGPNIARYLAVALALALGLMAKPMLVTWPFLFLLLDYWPFRRRLDVGLLLEKIPLVLLVAASASATFFFQRSSGAVVSLEKLPLWERFARAAVIYADYLGKTVWPRNLSVYGAEPPVNLSAALAAGAVLALLTAGALWGASRGRRWLAVGWFWFLGTLLPTIGLVQVGAQARADRFLYLPQIGLCVALAWGAADVIGRRQMKYVGDERTDGGRPIWTTAALLALAALAVCAVRQTRYWRDSEALWNRALACGRRDAFIHFNLGRYLAEHGRTREAINHYRAALSIKPDFVEALDQLGSTLGDFEGLDAAIAHFHAALDINPQFVPARNNLGIALFRCGRLDEAIDQFHAALEIQPEAAGVRCGLGAALLGKGKVNEAADEFQKALEIDPDNALAHNALGVVFLRRGKSDEAIFHFQKALEIKPDDVQARQNLELARAQKQGTLPKVTPVPK